MTSTRDNPATLADLLHTLRQRAAAATAADGALNPEYTNGYSWGWQTALKTAEELNALTAPDWAQPLRRLAADLGEIRRGTRLPTSSLTVGERRGATDALSDAETLTRKALALAALNAKQEQALAATGGAENLSDWSGYPKVPVPQVTEFQDLCLFLGGDSTSFTGDLLRLIDRADPGNLNRLSLAFPRHVAAFLMWRACAPVPADTLVKLLEAGHFTRTENQ